MKPVSIAYVVTTSQTARALLGHQLAWMKARGFVVSVVSSPGVGFLDLGVEQGVKVVPVPMAREIAPLRDLVALARLWLYFLVERPTVVNASTPKAGLLAMVAARFARVPLRIYTVRGLRLETAAGLKRLVLLWSEWFAMRCSNRIYCVSKSLRRRVWDLNLDRHRTAKVLGSGSSNGVVADRFRWVDSGRVESLRRALDIDDEHPVVGFVGRLTRDKGVEELVHAFEFVRSKVPTARLLMVGDYEEGDAVSDSVRRGIAVDSALLLTGMVADTAPYYKLMQVLALPSYREGFPNVCLEAAAAGLPTVGFSATGTVDAVIDGETGALVEPGDVDGLARALVNYLEDDALRLEHGQNAQNRAYDEFGPTVVWEAMLIDIKGFLKRMGLGDLKPSAPGDAPRVSA